MFKRILGITLASVMIAASLAGCSGSPKKSTDTSATGTPEASASEPEASKTVELTVWIESKKDTDLYKKMEQKFMEANPNIKINKIVHEGDPGNDFYQGVAAGNAPDYIECSRAKMESYSKAGILAPLDDYFAQWQDADKYDAEQMDRFKIGGTLYGIPTYGFAYYLGYNKALFKEAGITELPKTWDEMLEVAKKIADPAKGISGYTMQAGQWTDWFFQQYVWQAGGDLTKKNDDGTLTLTFTDPAVIQAAKFYQTLRKEKVVQSDLTMKHEDMFKYFASGKSGMIYMAGDMVPWVISLGMKAEDLGLMMPPAGPSGQSWVNGGIGGGYVINAKSSKEKQDAAWKWIAFRSSLEYETAYFEDQASSGPIGPIFTARTDFDISKIVDMDPEWVKITNDLIPTMRDEYYGKGTVTNYTDAAIQKCIADPNADTEKIFQAQQDLAAKEVLDDFNASVKEGN